jgi:hypothetical protein
MDKIISELISPREITYHLMQTFSGFAIEHIKIRLTNPEENLTYFLQEVILYFPDYRQLDHSTFRSLLKETHLEVSLFISM